MDIFDVFYMILAWFYQAGHIALIAIGIAAAVIIWYGQQQINGDRQ